MNWPPDFWHALALMLFIGQSIGWAHGEYDEQSDLSKSVVGCFWIAEFLFIIAAPPLHHYFGWLPW